MIRPRHILIGSSLVATLLIAALFVAPRREIVQPILPKVLTDAEYWDLVREFSEGGGTFRSENYVSNETSYQHVIPALKRTVRPDGIYLGVGPDQNFTYIGALSPRLAFIIDIRRQNMLLHLMYKALFELSNDRVEFLSKLFARPAPPGLSSTTPAEELFKAFGSAAVDPGLAGRTLAEILGRLRNDHGFNIDADTVVKVYRAFVTGGPEIRYSFANQYAAPRRFPTYAELMLENDGTGEDGGQNHSYMASDANFQAIKAMHAENRIIPIVGDFAGDKAIRSVGQYVRDHGARVSTFYTSNVEFYLFQSDDWRRFLNNLSGLPVDKDSVLIRSYFDNNGMQFQDPPSWLLPPPQSYTLLDNIPWLTGAFAAGRILTYVDVIRRSNP